MDEHVAAWVEGVLGPHALDDRVLLPDRKQGKGQRVDRVRCGQGRRWVLKRVGVAGEWRAEDHALRHWAPALDDLAPSMLASDERLRTILLSELPGASPPSGDAHVARQAGIVLRGIHRAAPPRRRSPAQAEHATRRVQRLLAETQHLLTREEQSFLRAETAPLADTGLEDQVPCHGDYRAHNWLVDGAGTLRVIDFGKSRWEAPAWDLTKLFIRPWWRRPRLAAAFLDGYGRLLQPAEADFIQRRMSVDALSHVAFGARRGSERHVRFGRQRLAALVAGHRVVKPRLIESLAG